MEETKSPLVQGSDNVFADLGLPNADEEYLKAELALQIRRVIQNRGLNQTQAAALLDVDQPVVSRLLNARLTLFSVERLLKFLTLLGHPVTIRIEPSLPA